MFLMRFKVVIVFL